MRLFCVLLLSFIFSLTALSLESNGANTQGKELFQIADTKITFPIPSGYCIPDGELRAAVYEINAMDDVNITHLTIINCQELKNCEQDGMLKDFGLLKSPKDATYKKLGNDRKKILKEMLGVMSNPEMGESIDKIKKKMQDRLNQTLLKDMQIGDIQDLGVIDNDEFAIYMGFVSTMSLLNKKTTAGCVVAITVVKQKLVFYYLYNEFENLNTLVHLLEKTKTHVRSFINENSL